MYNAEWYFDKKQNEIATAFKILWQTQGIYLSLIRTSEPFFFKVISENVVKVVLMVFCCRKQVDERIDSKSLDRDLFEDDDELEQLADEYIQIRKTMSQMNSGSGELEFKIYETLNTDDVGLIEESFEGLRDTETEKQSRRNSSITQR